MTLLSTVSSILGLTSIDSNYTLTIATTDFSSTFLFRQAYVVCFIGIPLNLFVVCLSFMNKSIQNNYKYFLANIAISHILLLCSLLNYNLVHIYLVDNNLLYTPLLCTIYRIWGQTSSVFYLNSLSLVSINRYVVVVRQNEDIFTNRVVFFSCLLMYWPILYPILVFTSPTHLVSDIVCGLMYWFPFIREILLIPVGILNIVSVFCIVKLFLHIRKHIETVVVHLDLSRLKDERSLLRAITIQGILPIVGFLPIVITVIIDNLMPKWHFLDQHWNIFGIIIDGPYVNFSMGLFQLCPVIDPLLTIFCVRQYRRIVSGWFRRNYEEKFKNRVQSVTDPNNQKDNHQNRHLQENSP